MATLYEQIGGSAGLAAVVDGFYLRVLANARLAAFFAGASIDALKDHQRAFLTLVLDGPDQYTGRTMAEAHAGRGITAADVERILFHLDETLAELRIDAGLIQEIDGRVRALAGEIVGV